jgi:cytochrome b561
VGFRIDSWVLFYECPCFHSVVAGRGIISSTIATGVLGFITVILFLFCIPDLDTFFALDAPQPFVQVYALALGKGPSIFMTIIAVLGLMMVRIISRAHVTRKLTCYRAPPQNTSIAVVASSRLIFAVARDGVLPLSGWIGRVTSDGQPKNAVTVMFVFAAALLCTILPSSVAFTSLVSAGALPTIAAYGLIALLRLTQTPHAFKSSHFYLGRWARPMYVSTVLFNGLIFAVRLFPLPHCAALLMAFLGHGLAVLLPRDGRHVQLCPGHLGRRDHLRCPYLVLHTCEQVVAPGTDRASYAHGGGSPRHSRQCGDVRLARKMIFSFLILRRVGAFWLQGEKERCDCVVFS